MTVPRISRRPAFKKKIVAFEKVCEDKIFLGNLRNNNIKALFINLEEALDRVLKGARFISPVKT